MDRPIKRPVDLAVYWTEYVLRQDDTSFMRPMSVNQTWYQRRMLDVWGFLVVLVALCLYCCLKVTKLFLGLVITRLNAKPKTAVKQKYH